MGLQDALQSYSREEVEVEEETEKECRRRIKKPDSDWESYSITTQAIKKKKKKKQGQQSSWRCPWLFQQSQESEAQPKLHSDIRFWLRESQGEVRIVLALTVNRKTPEIVIEKWEWEREPQAQGQDNRPYCIRTQQDTVYRTGERGEEESPRCSNH